MTIYETIKAAISVKQAAEHYGLKASRNGMACCPFHNDRHPSLKPVSYTHLDVYKRQACRSAGLTGNLVPL